MGGESLMQSTEHLQQTISASDSWAVAIIAARESVATLDEVVRGVAEACLGVRAQIDVLVNGNRNLAQRLAEKLHENPLPDDDRKVCVWYIEVGDKANTWNYYVHHLYGGAAITFFVDGYAHPRPNALTELALALEENAEALAATGIPSIGRSARQQHNVMQTNGGIHGNLFALTSRTMDALRHKGFRLPKGLYRTDSLVGAVICFGFDPAKHSWVPSRILVRDTSTWSFKPLCWWRWNDLHTHMKRMGRQAQGTIEIMAFRNHLARHRLPPEALPMTARELVLNWWSSDDGPTWYQKLLHPLWFLALRRFSIARDWSGAESAPIALYRNDAKRPDIGSDNI